MLCCNDMARANPAIKCSETDGPWVACECSAYRRGDPSNGRVMTMRGFDSFGVLDGIEVTQNFDYADDACDFYYGNRRRILPAKDVIESVDLHYEVAAGAPRHKVLEGVDGVLRSVYGVEGEPELPHAEKVVFSGPATVMLWPDGKKTITRCQDGDELDYVFGMLACILRKLTRNRGHAVEENEAALKEMAAKIDSMEDLDELLDYVGLMHDTLTVLRESSALWVDQLGDPEPEPEPEPAPEGPSDEELSRQAELMRQIAFMTKEMERVCAQQIDFGGDGDE